MMPTTMVLSCLNGTGWGLVRSQDEIECCLDLDAVEWYSYLMWRLPDGVHYDDVDPVNDSEEFLQCAGSSQRMVVEVRVREGNGYAQYCLGGAASEVDSSTQSEVIWGNHATPVHSWEVFTSVEALPIFISYFETGELPRGLFLRKILA